MLEYITSLLPRLQQFSKSLNDTAIFADVPWVFLDGDGERVTYIFRRNNELLLLANQQALPDLDAVQYLERNAKMGIGEHVSETKGIGLFCCVRNFCNFCTDCTHSQYAKLLRGSTLLEVFNG